jgi:hypothetical protein
MSDIKARHRADPDIDPIVAAQADDTIAATAVQEVTEPADAPPTADEITADAPALEAEASVADTTQADAPAEIEAVGAGIEAAEPDVDAVVALDFAAALEAALAIPAGTDVEADLASPVEADSEADPAADPAVPDVGAPAGAEISDTAPAVYADTIVDIEAVDDDAPLLDDELEHGIASVFAALHSAAQRGDIGVSDEPAGPLSESEAIDGVTFRLLGELDRLWHRAAA